MITIDFRLLAQLVAVFSYFGLVAGQSSAAAPREVRTIARSNQAAAGSGTARFQSFFAGFATVNDFGQVAFGAQLVGSGVNSQNEQGIWFSASPDGPHSLVSRFGMQPPGLPAGSRYGWHYESLDINNLGNVSFVAGLDPALNPVETGAWSSGGGSLHLLAAERHSIPGAPGVPAPTEGVYWPLLNHVGQTTFLTNFFNPTLWVDTPGQPLRPVASVGDLLPGGPNLHIKSLGPGLIADNGRIVFGARVTTSGDPIGTEGLWTDSDGARSLIARHGGTLPGVAGTITSIGASDMNPAGQIAVDAFVSSPPNSRVVAAERPDGSLRIVAQTHVPIPGSSDTLVGLYSPSINSHGHLAFPGFLSGMGHLSAPTSVWAEDFSGLSMVARFGDLAPGTSGAEFALFDSVQFNDFGELLFKSYLAQDVGGVTHENDEGLWLRTRNGQIILVAREGDVIDIDPGPGQNLQQIFSLETTIGLPNVLTSQRRVLTNAGEVLFYAQFHNGSSGLFLSLPIPESSTFMLAFLALSLCLADCRPLRRAAMDKYHGYLHAERSNTVSSERASASGLFNARPAAKYDPLASE